MPRGPRPLSPPRQWRITLTEQRDSALYSADLRWRTFPCRADEWHGTVRAEVLSLGPPIRSYEDLEGVLSLFIGVDWAPLDRRSLARDPVQK